MSGTKVPRDPNMSSEVRRFLDDLSREQDALAGVTNAPHDASYVTISTNATLTGERTLAGGTSISVTDGGAGNAVTIAYTGTSLVYQKAAESVGTGTTYTRAVPSGAKRVDIHLYNISHNNGASQNLRVELSTDGSTWSSAIIVTSAAFAAASAVHGLVIVQTDGSNNYWVSPGSVGGIGGVLNMSAEITHYRLSWSAGNFDSGNVITGAFI